MKLLVALALFASVPNAPAASGDEDQAQVDRAAELIGTGKPAEAVALLDTLINAQEARPRDKTRQLYCARTSAESLLYLLGAAKDKKAADVLPQSACYSVFLKGFALIDLNRPEEAKAWFERSVAMAPSNAQFLNELGEWHKNRHDWDAAWALFQRADEAASLSPKEDETRDKTRALRGMAFILVERGKLDDAEKLYRQCLKLDPNDDGSKRELQYIADRRKGG
jgi:tetratricopeptide (TPR) repeat protein